MKPVADMSPAELKSHEKQAKVALGALSGLVVVLALACGFITYQQGFTVFAVLPVPFLPLLAVLATNLQKIKTEIGTRKG